MATYPSTVNKSNIIFYTALFILKSYEDLQKLYTLEQIIEDETKKYKEYGFQYYKKYSKRKYEVYLSKC
jgi:hypothetical protein